MGLSALCFPVEEQRFPGIWRLVSSSLPFEQDIRSKLAGLIANKPEEGVLIKLNPDGTFKQCNENYQEGRWMSGRWKLQEGSHSPTLMLAMSRQYFGPPYDILLEGVCDDTSGGMHVHGDVFCGKFAHPTSHDAVFRTPMADLEALGPFALKQLLATSQLDSSVANEEEIQHFPGEENQFQFASMHEGSSGYQADGTTALLSPRKILPMLALKIAVHIQTNLFLISMPV
jgi:hypothetical protein